MTQRICIKSGIVGNPRDFVLSLMEGQQSLALRCDDASASPLVLSLVGDEEEIAADIAMIRLQGIEVEIITA